MNDFNRSVCVLRLLLSGFLLIPSLTTNAADTATHNRFGRMLLEANPKDGGCAGLTKEQVDGVSRWMDNPATKTGSQVDQSTQKLLTPSNHPYQRHNPFQVANAMSGKGAVYDDRFLARLNAARIHKVLDVAHNKVPVDGFKITPGMRSEAKAILEHVERNKRLPKQLPCWVDYRGVDGVTNRKKLGDISSVNDEIFKSVRVNQIDDYVDTSFKGLRSLPKSTQRKLVVAKLSKKAGRLLGRTVVVVTVAAITYDGYRIYTDQATVLDVAEENVDAFLDLAEATNYPMLWLDEKVEVRTGRKDTLKSLIISPTPPPSPREFRDAIATIRKAIDQVRRNSIVQKIDAAATEKVKETTHSAVGTKRNMLRTVLESGGTMNPQTSWFYRRILNQILPRDERN